MMGDFAKFSESWSYGTNEGEAHKKFWTAVLVKINTEKKVAERLAAMGIEYFLPVQVEYHQWSDRRKKINRIVIPMVLFVKVDHALKRKLLTYPYIYKFISYPGKNEAAKIPDSQIECLRFMLNQSDVRVELKEQIFAVGDEIEIIRGPLKGLSGKLCYCEAGKPTIGVNLDILGYACVNINKNDVEVKIINK